ncbi:hypothetical protein D9613_009041 [Agrocybe pediades]|uniref:Uncharacterized protein n=1 Tax=Agrocybe pediades TaxID=84607 RepID=A0A8H4R5F4_9AGAR|nr:hypothetical protein D9613_009041 [Agrocybe pediades]
MPRRDDDERELQSVGLKQQDRKAELDWKVEAAGSDVADGAEDHLDVERLSAKPLWSIQAEHLRSAARWRLENPETVHSHHDRGGVFMNLQLEVLDGLRQTFDIWFLQRLWVKHRLLFGFYLEGTWMWSGKDIIGPVECSGVCCSTPDRPALRTRRA